ncbi:hypothetical protein AB0L40_03395 [Patulibacter sp. NPDC049589]|uniref:hypothetical protein n=1 Tax=Patulibacter sp. NPDC049589 TaxID=3154731 RepID=UPI0034273C1A
MRPEDHETPLPAVDALGDQLHAHHRRIEQRERRRRVLGVTAGALSAGALAFAVAGDHLTSESASPKREHVLRRGSVGDAEWELVSSADKGAPCIRVLVGGTPRGTCVAMDRAAIRHDAQQVPSSGRLIVYGAVASNVATVEITDGAGPRRRYATAPVGDAHSDVRYFVAAVRQQRRHVVRVRAVPSRERQGRNPDQVIRVPATP